jgi:uncharacterized protein YqgV (UPF0045/DUF77 family)
MEPKWKDPLVYPFEVSGMLCFNVVGGDCESPKVDILHRGNFDGEDEWFEINYDDGDAVRCQGGDECINFFNCELASALVQDAVWSVDSTHCFNITNISMESADKCIGGLKPERAFELEIIATCDEAACLIDELDECFCSEEINNSSAEIIAATEEVESALSDKLKAMQDAIDAISNDVMEQLEKIKERLVALDKLEEIEERLDALDDKLVTMEDKLETMDDKLDELIESKLSGSKDEGSKDEDDLAAAAEAMMDVEDDNDSSRVIQFNLSPSTEYSVLFMFIFSIFMVTVCVYVKYKK